MQRLFGAIFFVVGFVLFCSHSAVTGAAIGTGKISHTDIFGISLMLIGLSISQLEKKIREHTEEGYRDYLEQKENKKLPEKEAKEAYKIESVYKATQRGVPVADALKIYNDLNRKVETGEYVELARTEPQHAVSENISQGTALYRFWGPKGLKVETARQAERLMHEGKAPIAKSQEIVVGSDDYGEIDEKGRRRLYGKNGEKKILKGRIPTTKPDGAMPKAGQVYHRHWEITDYYRHQYKK